MVLLASGKPFQPVDAAEDVVDAALLEVVQDLLQNFAPSSRNHIRARRGHRRW
jgi:hypothetical protein